MSEHDDAARMAARVVELEAHMQECHQRAQDAILTAQGVQAVSEHAEHAADAR